MRERLIIFIQYFLYWMLFFTMTRIAFLLYNADLSTQLTGSEILKSLTYGLLMDASMTGYLMVISGLLLTVSIFYFNRSIAWLHHGFALLFLLFSCIVIVVDFELYHHWGFRLNTMPLFYMGPEAAGSVEFSVVMLMISLMVILFLLFSFLYFAVIYKRINRLSPTGKKAALVLFVITALMFLPIRGSFSVSTMNVSRVYYHTTKTYANHTGINVVWNFLYSLQSDNAIQYPEDFFDPRLTERYFQELYPKDDSTCSVLTQARPNILLIIMEGITAEVVEPLGGRPGVMPTLNTLCGEGILFDRFYANGDRTDKGLVSILGSYPAQPRGSIIKYPQKTQGLSFLSSALEHLGYVSSFVYGGDVDFANYRSFLTNGRMSHITSVDDFPDEWDAGKWGVHDQFVYDQVLFELDSATKLPFFKTVLTISSHEPFTVPMETVIPGSDDSSKYMNACFYADKCLGDFIRKAKQKEWWKNTLVILTTDHGHRLPGLKKMDTKEKFHIPMLWLGGVIKKDTVIHTMANHTDIANTLLGQVDKPDDNLIFSKNIFGNNVKNFAVYIFNDGFGYLDNDQYWVFDNLGRQFIRKEGVRQEEQLNYGKAYIQKLYSDYNKRN